VHPALKKTLLIVLKLTVSGGLMYWVLSSAGLGNVVSLLVNIDPWAFGLAVLIFILTQFIASVRWGMLLPERHSLKRLFPLYLLGAFFNIFMPGMVGGDAVKIYYLYKETGKGADALSSVFMDRYVGLSALILLGFLAFPFGLGYMNDARLKWLLPGIVLAFAVGSALFFGLRLGRRFAVLDKLYGNLLAYKDRRGVLLKALAISLVSHMLSFTAVYAIAQGLGQDIPFLTLFIFIPIIATLAAVPLSISGLGIREYATVTLFGTIGISEASATAISFAWFLSVVVGGMTGLYELMRNKYALSKK
jgi:hypothetical protein